MCGSKYTEGCRNDIEGSYKYIDVLRRGNKLERYYQLVYGLQISDYTPITHVYTHLHHKIFYYFTKFMTHADEDGYDYMSYRRHYKN